MHKLSTFDRGIFFVLAHSRASLYLLWREKSSIWGCLILPKLMSLTTWEQMGINQLYKLWCVFELTSIMTISSMISVVGSRISKWPILRPVASASTPSYWVGYLLWGGPWLFITTKPSLSIGKVGMVFKVVVVKAWLEIGTMTCLAWVHCWFTKEEVKAFPFTFKEVKALSWLCYGDQSILL